jgi:hypothetical protein
VFAEAHGPVKTVKRLFLAPQVPAKTMVLARISTITPVLSVNAMKITPESYAKRLYHVPGKTCAALETVCQANNPFEAFTLKNSSTSDRKPVSNLATTTQLATTPPIY